MPLIIPPAPPQSIDAMRTAVPALAHGSALMKVAPRLSAALNSSSAAASLSPALSYKVYTLGLSDLASATGNTLGAATLSVWRHTLTSENEVVTADVAVDKAGTNYQFAAISSNPSAPAVQNEIAALSKSPDIAAASYEVSLLQIPALAVSAVWLHDPSGKAADILVPVAPVRSELVAGRRYTIAEFTSALKAPAAKILANDDPRKGS
jgi:hypothetical protein